MKVVEIIVAVLLALSSLALIGIVMLQSGKESGLSGALVGGSNESYLSKNKSSSLDKKLTRATKYVALAFAVLALALNLL